jgi:hypothetical protein
MREVTQEESSAGYLPSEGTPIKLNGNIVMVCAILNLVAVSVSEVDLVALFLKTQEERIIYLILHEPGYPQP